MGSGHLFDHFRYAAGIFCDFLQNQFRDHRVQVDPVPHLVVLDPAAGDQVVDHIEVDAAPVAESLHLNTA